jgi:hypothetical protein
MVVNAAAPTTNPMRTKKKKLELFDVRALVGKLCGCARAAGPA